eukprot:UN21086
MVDENKSKTTVGPVRWMAYESIVHKIYSKYSDIWMFGVFMWEILNNCKKPWTDFSNEQVIFNLANKKHYPLIRTGLLT